MSDEPATDPDDGDENGSGVGDRSAQRDEPAAERAVEIETALDAVEASVDTLEAELDAAETEADLDAVEAALDAARDDLDSVDIPDPPEVDDEEAEDEPDDPFEGHRERADDLESALDDVESGIEDERGPYAEDVVSEIDAVASEIDDTRWAEEGLVELRTVVDSQIESFESILSVSIETPDPAAAVDPETTDADADTPAVEPLAERLRGVSKAMTDADLDPDEDAETIAALLETTGELESGVEDATAWTDLEVREQLRREGYYDVLDHVKDFPPEWHALKVHEQEGNVDMVLLAFESLDSGFMEEHCLDALARMAPEEAIEPMAQRSTRRDQDAIRILGKIGLPDEDVVETLLEYVDNRSNPELQKVTFRALGELGATEAVEPVAAELTAETPSVRSAAARALGLLGDTRTIQPLAEVLSADESDVVRASAAWALAQIGTESALEELAQFSGDRSYLVQSTAQRAADAIGEPRPSSA